jgi:hypothetical protein
MGSEELAGEGDIGEVAAIGMETLVKDQRGSGEAKALSCAGG